LGVTETNNEQIGEGAGGRSRFVIARVCVVLILCVWVISGYGKVTDPNSFVNTVTEHRVLDQSLYGLLWMVGPTELLMGLVLVFVAGSELTKKFGRMALLVSMCAVIGLSGYLMMVDDAVLRESGCGCLDTLERIDFGMKGDVRKTKLVFNGVLVALHVVALGQPLVFGTKNVVAVESGGDEGMDA